MKSGAVVLSTLGGEELVAGALVIEERVGCEGGAADEQVGGGGGGVEAEAGEDAGVVAGPEAGFGFVGGFFAEAVGGGGAQPLAAVHDEVNAGFEIGLVVAQIV